jgi:hypothetical protein
MAFRPSTPNLMSLPVAMPREMRREVCMGEVEVGKVVVDVLP